MKRKKTIFMFMIISAFAGCAPHIKGPISGRIISKETSPPFRFSAPEIWFKDSQGKAQNTRFFNNDAALTIIAFMPNNCLTSSLALAEANDYFRRNGIPVIIVEIFSGSEECRSQKNCLQTIGGNGNGLIFLCDRNSVISKKYGVLKSKTCIC